MRITNIFQLTFYYLSLVFSVSCYSVPAEVWIRLECMGTGTPKTVTPVEYIFVSNYFIKADVDKVFPSIKELSRDNPDFFKNITNDCTKKRLKKVNLSGVDDDFQWMDWGTDHAYSYINISEVIYDQSPICKTVGEPCESSSECCSSNKATQANQTFCSQATHSCQQNSVIELPIGPSPQ